MSSRGWPVGPGWRVMLTDVGLVPADVLRRAALPDDLLARPNLLGSPDYFRFWDCIEQLGGPTIGLQLGAKVSAESFDAPLFAALCSRALDEAVGRVATYKRLIAPATLHIDIGRRGTALELEWLDATDPPPASLIDGELAFFVQLARLGTRARVCRSKCGRRAWSHRGRRISNTSGSPRPRGLVRAWCSAPPTRRCRS